ncbi:MAG: hypothetical protein AB7V46_06880, partial [Thermomicrobiales bacterium]
MNRSFFSTSGISRANARHPWRAMILWVVLLVLAGMSASSLNDALTTEGGFLNSPESKKGADLLESRLRGSDPASETVILRSDVYTVDDPEFRQAVDQIVAELAAQPEIVDSVAT